MEENLTAYSENDLLRLAKRFHNTKRTYLLVNPLQAKHIPVAPSDALKMLRTLGKKAALSYPECSLVIGFAETATAVGMIVAKEIAGKTFYIHTTRENLPDSIPFIEFREEHSHAVEQKLVSADFSKWLSQTETVIFVDDEISTGKTLLNFVENLKKSFPELGEKKLVAASIINRVSEENRKLLTENKIECLSLLTLPQTDYTSAVEKFKIREADFPNVEEKINMEFFEAKNHLKNPRTGVFADEYLKNCQDFAQEIAEHFPCKNQGEKILVMGSEECMYPAIALGNLLEEKFGANVFTHSTTRSPIGIAEDINYPILDGYKLHSFYEASRISYIYNLKRYEKVFIVCDSKVPASEGLKDISAALSQAGNSHFIFVRG